MEQSRQHSRTGFTGSKDTDFQQKRYFGGGSSSSKTTIRYAGYIEDNHSTFIDLVASHRATAIGENPFTGYSDLEMDDAFFGTGYVISNFPALYDMYGKFMAGLDIEVLFNQEFEDSTAGPEINNLVSAKASSLEDQTSRIASDFAVGMRDINSVMGDSFIIGKSIIWGDHVKKMSEFDSELRYRMIPVAVDRWKTHLEWNKNVIMSYAEIMKLYFSAKMDIDEYNYSQATKEVLWPFTVLDYERAALGAMQGAINSKGPAAGASTAGKAIGGALSGAATGAMVAGASQGAIAGPVGAAVGGLIGLAAGLSG